MSNGRLELEFSFLFCRSLARGQSRQGQRQQGERQQGCIATTKETTKEVPRLEAPLLWWQQTAATFVAPMNRVDVVAVNRVLVLNLGKIGGLLVGWTVGRIDGASL